jgi:hypothetical protein
MLKPYVRKPDCFRRMHCISYQLSHLAKLFHSPFPCYVCCPRSASPCEPLHAVLADLFAQRLVCDAMKDEEVNSLRDAQLGHGLGERRLIAQGQVVPEQGEVNVRGERESPRGARAEEHNPFDLRVGR